MWYCIGLGIWLGLWRVPPVQLVTTPPVTVGWWWWRNYHLLISIFLGLINVIKTTEARLKRVKRKHFRHSIFYIYMWITWVLSTGKWLNELAQNPETNKTEQQIRRISSICITDAHSFNKHGKISTINFLSEIYLLSAVNFSNERLMNWLDIGQ